MRVITDNIIFAMQKNGGVPLYWYEMLNRFIQDPDVELYMLKTKSDILYQDYHKLNVSDVKSNYERMRNLQVLRNIEPQIDCDLKDKTIFQSTYFRVSHKKQIKNVVTVYDFIYQVFDKSNVVKIPKIKVLLNNFQKSRAFSAASGIVCISESTKRDLLKFYPNVDNSIITVIPTAASNDYYPINNCILPKRFNDLTDKKYILFVGFRGAYKNFKFVVDVIKNTRDIYCVLIGGDSLSNEELESYGSSIVDRFIYYKGVSNEELNYLYNKAFCFIFPSLYEGFGIPILEAMKTKCPVIAFNNSSIPEVLRGSGILLNNNDLDRCIEELEKLNNMEYRKQIVEAEFEASKYFSWDNIYDMYIRFYKKILES